MNATASNRLQYADWLSSQDPLRQPRPGELPRPLIAYEPVNRERLSRTEWQAWMGLRPRKGSHETDLKLSVETEMYR